MSALRRIRIVECGEPLVDFLDRCPRLVLDRPRYPYRRAPLVRETPAGMLCRANDLLPAGYRLAVQEGWRPPHIQRSMYRATWKWVSERHPGWSESAIKRLVNRYSAPMDDAAPPPHTTGGAVDVMLADGDGRVLDHTSPYEPLDPRCCDLDAPGLSEEARTVRSVLAGALTAAGFTNYPSEFWHWSYGDQGWAYRGGRRVAIYGPTEPPGWVPDPAEDADRPAPAE